MKHSVLFLFFAILSIHICAQISPEQQSKVDSLFSDWDNENTPGAAIGIIQNGKMVYSKGYGMADLEHDVPLSPSSVFYMASVSKQFVTMGILLLEEQGELDLDDKIQKFLPDFPDYEASLTIRHFVHHTSGVRDYLTLWDLAGNSYLDHIDEDAVYELIKRQKSLNFTPGERYLYSNSCYFMLAMIIEKASGMTIRDFAERNMFAPLGMKNTHFHDNVYHIVKNRAFSYSPSDEGFDNLIMRFDLVGSGGLYSNIEDMFLWDQNFYHDKLGKGTDEIIQKMHEEGILNNGESSNYAFGLVNGTYRGLKTVGHGGSLAGYRTHILRFPDQKFSVIILANVSDFNPAGKAYEIADIFLKDDLELEAVPVEDQNPASENTLVTNETLEQYTGVFVIQPGIELTVSIEDDSLHFLQSWNKAEYSVKTLNESSFNIPGMTDIQFDFSEIINGKSTILTIDQGGNKTICKRKKNIDVAGIDLKEYEGVYYCEELDVRYKIFVEDGDLKSQIRYNDPWELNLSDQDQFSAEGTVFNFIRENEKISGFTIDAGRVQNLAFVRNE